GRTADASSARRRVLEEAHRVGVVPDEQALRLRVVVEHHLDRARARDEQADREGRLHRRDRDRAPDHAVRRVSAPGPLTTFSTPGGMTSPMSSQSLRIDHGVGLAGLTTVQLPAAGAGAIFHAAMSSEKLNGMICPTTPSGSRKW